MNSAALNPIYKTCICLIRVLLTLRHCRRNVALCFIWVYLLVSIHAQAQFSILNDSISPIISSIKPEGGIQQIKEYGIVPIRTVTPKISNIPSDKKEISLDYKKIEITQSVQIWNVISFSNREAARNTQNDLYIRRGRLGVKGKLLSDLSFNVNFAYDGVGRSKYTEGRGVPNGGDNRDFYLFEALTMWSYHPLLNITAGYFRPQIGREHMLAAFKTTSFEKSLSNFQPREHILARGIGRELGVNAGGLKIGKGWSVSYNLGIFDPSHEKIVGMGSIWAPLVASRISLSLGDPEMQTYGINYSQSYYGLRKGVTLSVNSSYQGKTEVFNMNSLYGGDVLANYGSWDFSIEYDRLYRNTPLPWEKAEDRVPTTRTNAIGTTDYVLSYTAAYNVILKKGKIIQPAAMFSRQLAQEFGTRSGLNELTGASDHKVYDIGVNYLIHKDNIKLNLHYVWGENLMRIEGNKYAYLGSGFQYLF